MMSRTRKSHEWLSTCQEALDRNSPHSNPDGFILGVHLLLSGSESQTNINSNPYVGVAFCGNTTAEAKALIDRTKNYTNLLVLTQAEAR